MKFKIIKKNRKYYTAETHSGYKCQILIDKNSEHLLPGAHELWLDDISERNKYGTKLKFKVGEPKVFLYWEPRYDEDIVRELRKIGNWEQKKKRWKIPVEKFYMLEKIKAIYFEKYYKRDDNDELNDINMWL